MRPDPLCELTLGAGVAVVLGVHGSSRQVRGVHRPTSPADLHIQEVVQTLGEVA